MIDPVILVQFTFPFSLCCLVCPAESGNWSELQQHLAEHLCVDLETLAWNKGKLEVVVSQGVAGSATGGGRGRQRSRCSSVESAQAHRTAKSKNYPFFTVWHPGHHPHFLMFYTRGTFRTDFGQKKNLLMTPCLPSAFFDVFHEHFLGFMVICRLNPKMESPQILHVCSVVFEQRAVIVDCSCLVVI